MSQKVRWADQNAMWELHKCCWSHTKSHRVTSSHASAINILWELPHLRICALSSASFENCVAMEKYCQLMLRDVRVDTAFGDRAWLEEIFPISSLFWCWSCSHNVSLELYRTDCERLCCPVKGRNSGRWWASDSQYICTGTSEFVWLHAYITEYT